MWFAPEIANEDRLYERVKFHCTREGRGGAGESREHTADDIMALYLIEVAGKVHAAFYKTLTVFVELVRECMNEYGWDILLKYKRLGNEENEGEYTRKKSAEHVPEISNIFIMQFLPKRNAYFKRELAVKLMFHFCGWLYRHQHTHTRIIV